jgi:hypothetical protein
MEAILPLLSILWLVRILLDDIVLRRTFRPLSSNACTTGKTFANIGSGWGSVRYSILLKIVAMRTYIVANVGVQYRQRMVHNSNGLDCVNVWRCPLIKVLLSRILI